MITPIVQTILEMVAIEGGIPYHTATKTTLVYASDIVVTDGGVLAIIDGASARFNSGCSPRLKSRLRENRDQLVDYFRAFREAETRLDDLTSPVIGSFQKPRPPCPTREGALPCECHGRKLGFPFGYVYARDGLKVVARPAEAPQETAKTPATDQPRKLSAASEGCGGEGNLSTDKGENEK